MSNRAKPVKSDVPPPKYGYEGTGSRIATFAEKRLKLPHYPYEGGPYRLLPFQRYWLRKAFRQKILEAYLSTPRKCGKSGLVAAVLLAGLLECGPLFRKDWRASVFSITFDLTNLLMETVWDIAVISGFDKELSMNKTHGRLESYGGARVSFLSGNKKIGGTGKMLDVAIVDEMGLLEESHRFAIRGMSQALATRNGKMLAISVMGNAPFMFEARERAKTSDSTFFQFHGAPADADPLNRDTWFRATPGLTHPRTIKQLPYIEKQAEIASHSEGDMNEFRVLDLNMAGDLKSTTLFSLSAWKAITVDNDRQLPPRSGEYVLGVDLGGSASMCAISAYFYQVGRVETWAAWPSDPPVDVRARQDSVGNLYEQMVDRGELRIYPGKVTPINELFDHVLDQLPGQPLLIVSDRARQSEMEDYLLRNNIHTQLVNRGTGWQSADEDIRDSQKEVLQKQFRHVRSVLVETALSYTIVNRHKSTGAAFLEKGKQLSRIDAATSLYLALAQGRRLRLDEQNNGSQEDGLFIPPAA